ncbi:AAA family ATPase [Pseudomonas sp. CCI3.2]|uniref:AAA family ATPase n=1 Tax=unclassified Pseudomonas TaxID=196821 RepID=UPI002AC9A00F|nr:MULTISPECIES: AAA family ATPase [unclassified Pseudomonas]MEB0078735.1 AAA family ATPase [Pseudomonas sp. MH10out]MEB0093529.1 AAA family ATPase [Pseudomonas sp. CCI4.2]MEB0100403.1 AAA family ATPase [Pseudomonas sp. CCI3.2]MEB0129573.1 AAA family ATPase [Pseudomonas sp. CCI2.4]MEB0157393.1 AAA family ATPase [Pseudomonas sp. AH2 (2023)]
MEIKNIRLRNVGRFVDLQVALAPTHQHASNVTVLVGNNGAGKTSLLKSVALSLSWLVARIRSEKGSGNRIAEDVIHNSASTASISISIHDTYARDVEIEFSPERDNFDWSVTAVRKGRKADANSQLTDVSHLADNYRAMLGINDQASVPLIVFYPVERSVLEIPLKIKTRHTFGQLDGYDNSLNGGVDFRRFFEWFREREDGENEVGVPTNVLTDISRRFGQDSELWHALSQLNASSRDRQLTAVRSAIAAFMPGFNNLRVQRKPRLHMAIDKDNVTLNVSQLSQGEKSMMALVGDIARRLAMMNPSLKNPLEGDGIVLIDEVDLHLHPKWQRTLVRQLTTTFPNCQFLLTTHSPLVISDAKDVLCYVMDDGDVQEQPGLYGLDANQVLLSVMDTDIRNSDVQQKLDGLHSLLQDGKVEEATSLYASLLEELPAGHLELAKAALLIRKLGMRRA